MAITKEFKALQPQFEVTSEMIAARMIKAITDKKIKKSPLV